MIVYLAGGVSGNLNPYWKQVANGTDCRKAMQIFLAGGGASALHSRRAPERKKKQDMQIYLAGVAPWRNEGGYDQAIIEYKPYILESFYYCDQDTERLLPYFGDFLLDSGAFTFMQENGVQTNFDEYIERYADFIKRNKIQKFFELDIDSVVGHEKVKEYRRKLEGMTNRQCIPVWHISRGVEEYKRLADEYNYIALGGIAIREIKKEQYSAFPLMIKEAHKRGAKVHGLGFTNLEWLKKCHFDSVDSTSWTTGNRFGFMYKFNGKTMIKTDPPKGHRIIKPREAALHNYIEWIKFQKYAEVYL